MIDVDRLYFEWLVKRLESDEEDSALGLEKLCWTIFHLPFRRRVGLDINRAINGRLLREEFLGDYAELNIEPELTNEFLDGWECSWLEMLIRLAEDLDDYYEGGPRFRFLEMCHNLELASVLMSPNEGWHEHRHIEGIFARIDESCFDEYGRGGLFPLQNPGHSDQREVEIWNQASAYFVERIGEGDGLL